MKYLFLTILLIPVTHIALSQSNPVNCSFFKTGDLAYRDSTTNSIWEIKRTQKTQIERNKQSGIVVKNKIQWLTDCEYKLTQVWTNSKKLKKRNNMWLIYRITSVNENTYTYTCNCNDGTKIEGVVVKMRY